MTDKMKIEILKNHVELLEKEIQENGITIKKLVEELQQKEWQLEDLEEERDKLEHELFHAEGRIEILESDLDYCKNGAYYQGEAPEL